MQIQQGCSLAAQYSRDISHLASRSNRGRDWSQNDMLQTDNLSTNEGSLGSLCEELNNESSQELYSGSSKVVKVVTVIIVSIVFTFPLYYLSNHHHYQLSIFLD